MTYYNEYMNSPGRELTLVEIEKSLAPVRPVNDGTSHVIQITERGGVL